MATNILTTIRKPLTSNKRLFGLVTIALLVIGILGASYWYHIKSNEQNFREYKLQTIDSYYDIISKRFTNDIQTHLSYLSKSNGSDSEKQKDSTENEDVTNQEHTADSTKRQPPIWEILTNVNAPLPNDNEFDEYIVRFKNVSARTTKDTTRYLSSLKGSFHAELDSLLITNKLNIGVSVAIPKDDPRYQLFAREYIFKDNIESRNDTVESRKVEIEIAIIGLVSADRYGKYTRKLDSWIIALLVTSLLLCLFGLPFFKMIFIAEDERLHSKDVIMAGTSILVGAPIIVAIFLSLVNHFDSYYHTIPNRLKHFGEQITEEFFNENNRAIQRLDQLDMGDYEHKDCHTFDCICKNDFIPLKTKSPDSLQYNFKFISKMYDSGQVCYTINTVSRPKDSVSTINLKERVYFKDFTKGINLWKSPDDTPYVMRPVVSIEDQKEEAVYILQDKTDKDYFKVGSAQLRSVHNPVVPFGYQYAVIDDKGEVWFHSKIGRSTLENFFSVSRQFGDLKAAVNGRVAAQGVMKYRDESQLFDVSHIKGTNLSVVTLYDLGLLRVRVSEVLSITGIAIFFILLLIGLIALFLVLKKNTTLGLYKFKAFPFEFLTPKSDKEKSYILLSTLFLGVLVIAVPMSVIVSFLPSSSFILSFLFVSWSYLLVYYSLNPRNKGNKLKLRLSDTLLLLVIFGLDIMLLKLGSQVIWILLVVLPVQLICSIYLFKLQKIEKHRTTDSWVAFIRKKLNITYPKNYILFLFSWLLLASVFPTTLFFKKAKELNDLVWTKTDQFYMSREYIEKEARIREKLPPRTSGSMTLDNDSIHDYHLKGGQYLGSVYWDSVKTTEIDNNFESDYFRKILWSTRPIYDEKIRDFQAMIYRQSLDQTWKSIETDNTITFQMDYRTRPKERLTSSYPDETNGPYHAELNWFMIGIKIFGLFGILVLLFTLISFFIDRFIGFRFMGLKPNDFDTAENRKYIPQFAEVLNTHDANSGLLLTGLPFSGKTAFAKKVLKAANCENPMVLSLLKLDDLKEDTDIFEIIRKLCKNQTEHKWLGQKDSPEGEKKPTLQEREAYFEGELRKVCAFVVENLEHQLMSFDANRIKLRLVSYLISLEKPVVLCSEVYPSQILGFYQNAGTTDEGLNARLLGDFNAWRNILSAFPQVLIGITDKKAQVVKYLDEIELDGSMKKDIDSKQYGPIKKRVADELGYSKFLPTLAPVIYSKYLNIPDKKDSNQVLGLDEQRMVMHTQNLSHGYYTDIWNSLPTRERYMLYDLAKDGFLNIKNGNSLFSLMKKGLIVWDDRPAIFNSSFKNFISSSVSMNEALRLEYKKRGEGSWGTMRVLFYLIILTIIVFIFLGEPGLLKDFEALIGALGGISVIVPILSTVLARGGQKR